MASQGSANQRTLPQSKEAQLKTYQKRLKEDVKSMLDNYLEIFRLARLEEDPQQQINRYTQAEQDQYEMEIRGANIVRAGESLMKLVSDIKQFLILNEFISVNEAIANKTTMFRRMQTDFDLRLLSLRDDMASDLYELEEEYYASAHK